MARHYPRMRTALTYTILLMGLIAIALSIITGKVYQQTILDNERISITELVKLDVDEQLTDLYENSKTLGLSVYKSQVFKSAFSAKPMDIEKIRTQLDSRFHQYFVTADVIQLEKIYLFDAEMQLITMSSEGLAVSPLQPIICDGMVRAAAKRSGPIRLKPIDDVCLYEKRAHFAVLMPFGGLIPKGYLLIVANPAHNLKKIETALGFPVQLKDADGYVEYQSQNWPQSQYALESSLLADFKLLTSNNEVALHVSAARNLQKLNAKLVDTQLVVIVLTIVITLVAGVVALWFLRLSALQPMQQLGAQVNKISQDNTYLGEQIEISGVPEIMELAAGFNHMTSDLRMLYNDLLNSNLKLTNEIDERMEAEQALQHAHAELEVRIKERTAELEQMSKYAEAANDAKTEFLSRMSHELRTPLSAIIGFAQLLLAAQLEHVSEEQRKYIEHILHAGTHLLELINEVLDLARVESGQLKLQLEAVQLDGVLDDALVLIEPIAIARNIAIEFDKQNLAATLVAADRSRLKQIFLNLLSNAIKYNRTDGKVIVEVFAEQDGNIRIAITDTGTGLSAEQQQKLFIPFSRLDADTRQVEGTGIGLTISKRLVELMGGQIGVQSQPGNGTTFWFTLQSAGHETLDATNTINLAEKRELYKSSNNKTFRILVVEDNELNQELLEALLEEYGYQYDIAGNGEKAIELFKQQDYDLILMDVHMPVLNGFQTTEIIRQNEQDKQRIPIIAVTANAMKGDRDKCLSAGMDDYIEKPFDFVKFDQKIQKWLNRKSA